jgi:hypothetical protein
LPLKPPNFWKKPTGGALRIQRQADDHVTVHVCMDRHVLGRRIAKRGRVHEADVRRVDKVFRDIQIVRLEVQCIALVGVPLRV